jgi:hypothetical protein
MNIPTDFSTWLKVGGALSAGLGSILLAWRVKSILQWVVYCLTSHEDSIMELSRAIGDKGYSPTITHGVITHLLAVEDKLGLFLLFSGFVLLGIGMLSSAASFLFGTG